jgi:uroporphyrinogen decarboxylase
MNSIERVKAAIYFNKPDRAPAWMFIPGAGDVLPLMMLPSDKWMPGHAAHEKGLYPFLGNDDFVKMNAWEWRKPDWALDQPGQDWLKLKREETDEFGIIWNREGTNATMGHPGRPAIADWADYETYLSRYSPDASDRSRYDFSVKISSTIGADQYRMAMIGFQGPFNSALAIRGFVDFLTDHHTNPDEVRKLLAHLTKFYVKAQKAWVDCGAKPNGFIMYDDLADQFRPFMSPEMFRKFYEPVYRPIFDTAHRLGCEMHLHSCGNIVQMIPILMEWGLDGLQLESPRMCGYPGLAPFRGKIMIWGDMNIQTIYPKGTPDEVEREVWHMVRNLGTPEGGYGAYFYPSIRQLQIPIENVRAFKRGLEKYGDYSKISPHWWTTPPPAEWKDNVVPPLPE